MRPVTVLECWDFEKIRSAGSLWERINSAFLQAVVILILIPTLISTKPRLLWPPFASGSGGKLLILCEIMMVRRKQQGQAYMTLISYAARVESFRMVFLKMSQFLVQAYWPLYP